MIAMTHTKIFAGICLCLLVGATASAMDIQEGMHGMQWSRPASEFEHLKKVRESGPVAYYVNANTLYQVADQTVPAVVYGFYENRFFAAYIKLGSALQFNNLKRHFSGKYGPPKTAHRSASKLTVLRWSVADVNVKLKMNETGQDVKMAVYYLPLAREIDRDRLESIDPGLYRAEPPAGEKGGETVPLL
jgi:hypothetical protein